MIRLHLAFALSLIAAAAFGCGDDSANSTPDAATASADAGGIGVADLVGSWAATAHSFTNNANAAETFDLSTEGVTTRMTVLAGGGVRTWIEDASEQPWEEPGMHMSGVFDSQWGIIGDTLRVISDETPSRTWDFSFVLDGSTLTLTNPASDFDFTRQDQTPVSATSTIVLQRQ